MFDGLFSYRYNMRLKSPCEIASDMTLWFSAFPNFRKKWANLRLSSNFQKQKVLQLQGGFAPRPPDQGLCRWTPLGAPPLGPRWALRARHAAPLPNPKYATENRYPSQTSALLNAFGVSISAPSALHSFVGISNCFHNLNTGYNLKYMTCLYADLHAIALDLVDKPTSKLQLWRS